MKRYPAYAESAESWLPSVPVHWHRRRLKFAAPLRNERVPASGEQPYLGMENVESWTGKISVDAESPPTGEGLAVAYSSGNVLFGKLRPYLAKVARPAIAGVGSTEFLVLRPVEVRAFASKWVLTEGLDRREQIL